MFFCFFYRPIQNDKVGNPHLSDNIETGFNQPGLALFGCGVNIQRWTWRRCAIVNPVKDLDPSSLHQNSVGIGQNLQGFLGVQDVEKHNIFVTGLWKIGSHCQKKSR